MPPRIPAEAEMTAGGQWAFGLAMKRLRPPIHSFDSRPSDSAVSESMSSASHHVFTSILHLSQILMWVSEVRDSSVSMLKHRSRVAVLVTL